MHGSIKEHLRTQWIENAMRDPCLFHATMFSEAASLDILMGRQLSHIALYHQVSTIRLLGEQISLDPTRLDYGALGSVIPLIFYNVSFVEV
jgi:hypothetical protein